MNIMKARSRHIQNQAEMEYFEQLKNVMQTAYILSFLAACDFVEADEAFALKMAKHVSIWQEYFNEWRKDGVLDEKVEAELNSLGLSIKDFSVDFTYDDLKKECKNTNQKVLSQEDLDIIRENLRKLKGENQNG